MANHVQGKNIIGSLKVGDVYYPIFCGKTLRLTRSWQEIETTNINSGSDRDFEAGMGEGMFEVTGVTILDNDDGRIAITYLMQAGAQRLKRDWRIVMTDNDGSSKTLEFEGIIRETSFDKIIPGYSTSYLQVRLCGALSIDPIEPPPGSDGYIEYSDYWDTVNGENWVDGNSTGEWNNGTPQALAEDDEIMVIDVEGTQYNLVTGTPQAGKREASFDDTTGRVTFPADLIFDGTQRVFINWKRPL